MNGGELSIVIVPNHDKTMTNVGKTCFSRELNPGLDHGKVLCYHYTTEAFDDGLP